MQCLWSCSCRVWVLAACVLLTLVPMLAQQGEGTITGTVLDQAGKAVPNATIEIKSEANGSSRSVNTDAEGHFSAAGVAAGTYSILASAQGFAVGTKSGQQVTAGGTQDVSIVLNVGSVAQSISVEGQISIAAQLAPSGNTLDAVSAKTEISPTFVQNFIPPTSDFAEVVNYAPGTFAVNTNGVGLGQGKTFFRGFKDGQYTMAYDGIPFQDTNDPTHHSWVFFPAQWIGGADFDRSPGTASSVGPTNYGGSINLLSRDLPPGQNIRGSASYGSFNTRLFDLAYDSGQFGGTAKKSSLFIDLHQLLSDGYQTYNYQKRVAGAMKYQYRLSEKTQFTVDYGMIDLWTNTPDWGAPLRSQVAQFGDVHAVRDELRPANAGPSGCRRPRPVTGCGGEFSGVGCRREPRAGGFQPETSQGHRAGTIHGPHGQRIDAHSRKSEFQDQVCAGVPACGDHAHERRQRRQRRGAGASRVCCSGRAAAPRPCFFSSFSTLSGPEEMAELGVRQEVGGQAALARNRGYHRRNTSGVGCDSEEVRAILPGNGDSTGEPQVHLIHKRGDDTTPHVCDRGP
jgi:hypothetical protein